MENKDNRISELFDSYSAIVSLSMLAIAENDIEGAICLNKSLKKIYEQISGKVSEKQQLTLESYQKLLGLEYSKLSNDNAGKKLKTILMSIDFDYDETLHWIGLAQLFQKEKKYKEAIMLAEYLTTVCDSAPPYLVLAKTYRDLKMYDMSIKGYNTYLLLNENDKEAKQELDKVFEEMLELK